MPHSSLFLPFLHSPTPLSSFLSSTHTNRLPHSFLFLHLLQLNTLLLLPTPLSADSCPRALHASDSPLLSLVFLLQFYHTLYTTNETIKIIISNINSWIPENHTFSLLEAGNGRLEVISPER